MDQPLQLARLSEAEHTLATSRDLSELRGIRDVAVAALAYAKAHKLGFDMQCHCARIITEALARIGELTPKTPPRESGAKGGKTGGQIAGRGRPKSDRGPRAPGPSMPAPVPPLPSQRMAEARKVAARVR